MSEVANLWKKCSSCKKPIFLGSHYYECSVSTCTGDRTGYVFCSVGCWEAHIPGANHRSSAGAIEKFAPKTLEARRIIPVASPAVTASSSSGKSSSMSNEVLVVVSKMKQYIRDTSDFNTSEDVNQVLSNMVRIACDRAVEKAKVQGRKTVMAKDFSF
ncbi:MAG: hypothetical protein H7235_04960 [Bdellovibrionaceae bacterium]|nr:hypothetical protein [Pseudobdellovibrionaceae bacterium]